MKIIKVTLLILFGINLTWYGWQHESWFAGLIGLWLLTSGIAIFLERLPSALIAAGWQPPGDHQHSRDSRKNSTP